MRIFRRASARRAAIGERLGYTLPVVDYALDRLFERHHRRRARRSHRTTSSARSMRSTVSSSSPAARRPGRAASNAVTIVSSDTTIGVAIVPLIFALCAKCAVTVKDRADALVAAFVDTLGEERTELRAATDVRAWTRRRRRRRSANPRRRRRRRGVRRQRRAARDSRALRARCDVRAVRTPRQRRIRQRGGTRRRYRSAGRRRSRATRCSTTATAASRCTCFSSNGRRTMRTSASSTRWPPHVPRTRSNFRADRANRRGPPRVAAYTNAADVSRCQRAAGACSARAAGAWSIVVDPPRDELPPFGGGVIPVVFVDGVADAAAFVERASHPAASAGRRILGCGRARWPNGSARCASRRSANCRTRR